MLLIQHPLVCPEVPSTPPVLRPIHEQLEWLRQRFPTERFRIGVRSGRLHRYNGKNWHRSCWECPKNPKFNYPDKKERLFCRTHRLDGMVDIGNTRCIHGQQFSQCKDCKPASEMGKHWCQICKQVKLSRNRVRAGIIMCSQCDKTKPPRTEHIVWDHIKGMVPHPSSLDSIMTGGCSFQPNRRRPDMVWVGMDRYIHGEVDEHSHDNRPVGCETAKMTDTRWGVHRDDMHKLHIFIRMNPDEYDGPRGNISFEDRCTEFAREINYWITADISQIDPKYVWVKYMFYHSRGYKHIEDSTRHNQICSLGTIPDFC